MKETAHLITGRNSNQITFDVHHDENENNPADANNEDEADEVIEEEVAAPSEGGRKGIRNFFKPIEEAGTLPPFEIKMKLDNKAM